MSTILAVVVLCCLLALAWYMSCTQPKDGPPIDYGIFPFLGHISAFTSDPIGLIRDMKKKHGDTFTLYIMGNYFTCVNDMESIKTMMTSRLFGFSEFFDFILHKYFSPKDLYKTDEKRTIKIIHHYVTTKENVAFFLETQKKVTIDFFKALQKKGRVDFFAEVSTLVCDMNCQQFLDFSSPDFVRDFLKTDPAYAMLNSPFKSIFLRKLGMDTEQDVIYKKISEKITALISDRRKGGNGKHNPLDIFLNMDLVENCEYSDQEIVTTIWQMIFAAQLNTASFVAWAVYHLFTKNEPDLALIRQELETAPQDFDFVWIQNNLPLTDKYLYEIFRIYFKAVPCGRLLLQDTKLAGFNFKKDSLIFHGYIGRGGWELSGMPPSESVNLSNQDKKVGTYQFTPWGAGIHPCAGKVLALNEAKLILVLAQRMVENLKPINQDLIIEASPDWVRPKIGNCMVDVTLKK